jgi:predicted ATP-dependent protease
MATKKAAKKSRRTVMYSSGGKKLYAVRDASGKFKDIQQYSRAHAMDIKRGSGAEVKAAVKKAAKKVAKKAAKSAKTVKKTVARKSPRTSAVKSAVKKVAKRASTARKTAGKLVKRLKSAVARVRS